MDIAIIPRCFLDRIESDSEKRIHVNVLMSHLLLVAFAVTVSWLPSSLSLLPHVCLFESLLGIVCPGCGVTGSLLATVAGDVVRAWTIHPAGPIIAAALVIQVPLRILALRKSRYGSYVSDVSRRLTSGVLVVLALNWFYRIT